MEMPGCLMVIDNVNRMIFPNAFCLVKSLLFLNVFGDFVDADWLRNHRAAGRVEHYLICADRKPTDMNVSWLNFSGVP